MKQTLIILLALTALITPPAFAVNRVLSLDGDGDYVEISDSESLNAINSQVTMEAWIKPTAFPNTWISIIYKGDKRTSNISNRSYVLFLNSSGAIHLASAPVDQGQIYLDSPPVIALNTWYHVAGVIDAHKGMMRIFINGAEVARRDFGTGIHLSALPLRIGSLHEEEVAEHSPFAGQIDEVRIWSLARTEKQIVDNMLKRLRGDEPGLVGYWDFEGEGEAVRDVTGNGNDGQLVGDATRVEAGLPTPGEVVVPTVLSGIIKDAAGKPIPNAAVSLEQDGKEIAQAQTDASGNYWIAFFQQVRGQYNLSAMAGELAAWQLGLRLREGERRKLNLTLTEAISIEGTLLMLDDKTPHVSVPVQAMRDGKVVDGVLSDESGKYQFINLKPGKYQVRCQVLGGHVYYRTTDDALRVTLYESPALKQEATEVLSVEQGRTLKNIDFRFAPFKLQKGKVANLHLPRWVGGELCFCNLWGPQRSDVVWHQWWPLPLRWQGVQEFHH